MRSIGDRRVIGASCAAAKSVKWDKWRSPDSMSPVAQKGYPTRALVRGLLQVCDGVLLGAINTRTANSWHPNLDKSSVRTHNRVKSSLEPARLAGSPWRLTGSSWPTSLRQKRNEKPCAGRWRGAVRTALTAGCKWWCSFGPAIEDPATRSATETTNRRAERRLIIRCVPFLRSSSIIRRWGMPLQLAAQWRSKI